MESLHKDVVVDTVHEFYTSVCCKNTNLRIKSIQKSLCYEVTELVNVYYR